MSTCPQPAPQSDFLAGSSASPSAPDDISFLRLPDVKLATGLSKSNLYGLIRANSFPAPVPLGLRSVGWVKSEIQQWAAERVRLRDTQAAAALRPLASCASR
jgi:prophage regulatory protein